MTHIALPARNRQTLFSGTKIAWPAESQSLVCEVVDASDWDRIAATFEGISQEQTYTFGKLRWPAASQEARIFKTGGEIVGGAIMRTQKLPLGLGAISVCKWGPILKDNLRPDRNAIYRGMIAALVDEYAYRRRNLLSVMVRSSADDTDHQYEILKSFGFREGTQIAYPSRYLVNLKISEDEQRASFEQKWRYHLRRAEKAGLTFHHAGPSDLGEFDRIYRSMSERKRFPDYSAYNSLSGQISMNVAALQPEIFFVRKDGETLAGAVIFKAGDTAAYLYGATTDAALPLRAGYLMHWEIIRWLKANTGVRWYDLGGSDGFHGLHQFKKGMVGAAGRIVSLPPMANLAVYRSTQIMGGAALAGRDVIMKFKHTLRSRWSGEARPDQNVTTGGG